MVLVTIRSVQFPGRFVRLDGNGVTSFTGSGGGTVNTQKYSATYETFTLVTNDDGTVSFKSTVFNDVFLRVNASGVPAGEITTGGGGVVNAQFTARTLERFRIQKKETAADEYTGIVGIESDASPGRFLRLDGNTGKVNVQGVFKTYEEFEILVVGV